jgi:hypothetical protein
MAGKGLSSSLLKFFLVFTQTAAEFDQARQILVCHSEPSKQ